VALLIAVAAGFWRGTEAHAADPVAESLFQEAMELMHGGSFAEACRRLEESNKLEPMSGTLILLGNCYENLGRTATAWAHYMEAFALARSHGRPNHARKAAELAAAMQPRLSKIRIDAHWPPGGPPLTIRLDGVPVEPAQLGVEVPVDPGEHTITASASWSATVTVGPNADLHVVTVPSFRFENAIGPGRRDASASAERGGAARDASRPIPAWVWASGALGIGWTALSVGFAIDQQAASSEIERECGPDRDECTRAFDFRGAYAREKRDNHLFIGLGTLGLVGIGIAAIGFATRGSSKRVAANGMSVEVTTAGTTDFRFEF
jgi:hypothetical protein